MRSLKQQLPWPQLLVFFTIGVSIYLAEIAKPFAQPFAAVLTALQITLAGIAILLGIRRIWPFKFVRLHREAVEGEFYECRSMPILALIVILPILLIFGVVALFVLSPSNSDEAKGNLVLFSSLLAFILVPAAALLRTRIIFAPTRVCFSGRLFSREFLTCVPAANLGPWAALGPLVFPTRYGYLPLSWHLVTDPASLVIASRRALAASATGPASAVPNSLPSSWSIGTPQAVPVEERPVTVSFWRRFRRTVPSLQRMAALTLVLTTTVVLGGLLLNGFMSLFILIVLIAGGGLVGASAKTRKDGFAGGLIFGWAGAWLGVLILVPVEAALQGGGFVDIGVGLLAGFVAGLILGCLLGLVGGVAGYVVARLAKKPTRA